MDLKELQKEIIENRKRRGWSSAGDLSKTTLGLAEEVGEFERARKSNNKLDMLDALADIMVYCLGGFEILEADSLTEVNNVVEINKTRTHNGTH
jgi:NTP pyrophosphatase (non-canonical NTP hydrolase)